MVAGRLALCPIPRSLREHCLGEPMQESERICPQRCRRAAAARFHRHTPAVVADRPLLEAPQAAPESAQRSHAAPAATWVVTAKPQAQSAPVGRDRWSGQVQPVPDWPGEIPTRHRRPPAAPRPRGNSARPATSAPFRSLSRGLRTLSICSLLPAHGSSSVVPLSAFPASHPLKPLVLPDGPATRGAATSWRVFGAVWVLRWSVRTLSSDQREDHAKR